MSPEVQAGKPYGKEADIWAFGILMRELLDGDVEDIQAWLLGSVYVTIKQLLNKTFGERVKSVEQAKELPFFKGTSWDDVRELRLIAPYIPPTFYKYKAWLTERRFAYKQSSLNNLGFQGMEVHAENLDLLAHPSYDDFAWVSPEWISRHSSKSL